MNRSTVMQITTINPLLQCHLCTGYLVDATTITECLHSFCRSCIVQYLSTSSVCPMCDQLVHKTRPLSYIRSDKTLQDMVYKLVPRLYQDEMKRRRSFYAENPDAVPSSAQLDVNEQKGIIDKDKDKLRLQSEVEDISLVLYECPYGIYKGFNMQAYESPESCKRYLRCPSNVTIAVLKSFIEKKEMFPSCYKVKIYYIDDILRSTDTLTDIAFFYQWKRVAPLKLLYTIVKSPSSVDPSTATPCANAVNFDPGFASLLRSPSKSTAASHSSNSSSSSSARVGRPSGKSHHNNNNNKSTGNNKLTRRNIARHLSACSSSAAAGSSSSAATSNHSSLASRSCSQLLRQQRQRQMRKRKVYPRHDEKSTRQVRKEQQDDHDDDDDWNSNATRSRKRQRSSKRVSSHDEDSLNESSDDTLVGDVLISPTSAYTSVPDADQTPREEVDKPREVDDGDLKDNLGAAHHTSSDSDTPLSALRSCKPISLSSDATTTSSTTTTANSTSIKAQTKPCWPRLSPSPSIHVKANDTSTPLQQPPQTSNVLPSTMLNSPHKSQVSPVKTCNGVNGFPSADSSKNQTADVCKTLIKTERMEVEEVPPPSNLLDSKEHLKSKLNKLGIATSENTTTNLQQVPTSVCSSSDSTPTPANIKNPTSSVGGGCTTTTTSLTCAIKQSRHGLHVIRPITPSSKSITAVTKTTPPTNAPQQPSTTATTTTTTTTTSVTHVTRPFQLINKVIAAPTGHQIKNSGQPSSSLPNNASSPTLPILSNRPPTLGSSNANLSSNHVTNPSKPYMRTSIRPPTLPTTSRSATTTASITTSCSNSTVGASINPHVQAPIIISKRTNGYVRILPKPMAPLNNSALNSGHSSNSGSSRGSPSPLTLPPPDIGKLMKKVLAKKSGKNSGTSSLSVKIPDSNAPQTVSSISEQLLRQISSPINTLVTSNNTTTSTSVLHTPSSTAAKATSKTTLTTSLKRKHSSPPNGVHQTPAAVKKRRVTSSDGSNHAPSTPCNNVSPSASLKSAISPDGLKLTIRNDASPILNGKPSPSLQEIVLGSVNASSKHSSHHHHHHSSRQHQSSQSKSDKQNSKEKLNTITIKSEKTTTDDNVTASIANVEVSNKPSCQDKTIGKQCKTNGICNNVSSDKFTSSTSTFTSSKPISTSTTTSSLVNTPSTTTTTSTDTTTNSTTTTSITTSTASDNKNTSTQAKPPLQTAIQMSPLCPK